MALQIDAPPPPPLCHLLPGPCGLQVARGFASLWYHSADGPSWLPRTPEEGVMPLREVWKVRERERVLFLRVCVRVRVHACVSVQHARALVRSEAGLRRRDHHRGSQGGCQQRHGRQLRSASQLAGSGKLQTIQWCIIASVLEISDIRYQVVRAVLHTPSTIKGGCSPQGVPAASDCSASTSTQGIAASTARAHVMPARRDRPG